MKLDHFNKANVAALVILFLVTVVSLLSGCCTEVPILKQQKMVSCAEVPPELLIACDRPIKIAEGSTFDDGFVVDAKLRKDLAQCSDRHQNLIRYLASCQKVIDHYNSTLPKQ